MRMNHLHLMVPDVRATTGFFEKYFALRRLSGNAGLTVLLDDGGFVLTVMKRSGKSVNPYPDNFHVGFFVTDVERVEEMYKRMLDDGLAPSAPRREHSYSFYVNAPGGFLVEVGA
jgi:lactoylglutathione lyase